MDDRDNAADSKSTGHPRIAPTGEPGAIHLRLSPWAFDADDGFCADLDAPTGDRGIVVRAGWHAPGTNSATPSPAGANRTAPGTVARAISDTVDSERARAAQADIAIRTEMDPSAAGLPASQVGAILGGLLARAVDACLGAASRGDAPLDGDEIVVVTRLDGSWLHVHVIDGAAAPAGGAAGLGTGALGTQGSGATLALAAATARSIGGTLELRNVPFGPGTLATARLPLTAFAATG